MNLVFLLLSIPVVIVVGLALYFEKRSGMTVPDENVQAEKFKEFVDYNRVNANSNVGGNSN
ncbi:MAG TPA: hypothetical protein VNR61_02575 [Niallia sp.]|nr:hypothetical protein [Niallia sp.]